MPQSKFPALLGLLTRNHPVKTTITVDQDKLEIAKEYTGISENQELVQRAIEYIIAYQKGVACALETGNIDDIRVIVRQLYDNVE